jgi:CRISP-associated protein Cas1
LYGQIERAIVLAGLDPYAGFIHTDRPGKPSLTLDLIEPFRQCIADRAVLGMLNKGTLFSQDERGYLTGPVRKQLAEKILARMESAEPFEGKRFPLRAIVQAQARQIAAYLRRERDAVEPFVAAW